MVANEKTQIRDNTKLAELTVGEFKTIVREIVQDIVKQAMFELEQYLPNPDEGKPLKPEVAEELRRYLQERPDGRPVEDVMKELGLLDE